MDLKRVNNIVLKPPPLAVQIQSVIRAPPNNLFDTYYPNIFICGKKNSGKTNLILNILDNIVDDKSIIIVFCNTVDVSDMWKHICAKYIDRIVKYNTIVEEDKNTGKKINNLEAFIKRMGDKKRSKENNNYIVIFDDISDELRNSKIPVLYKQNRHFNCTTITSTQGGKDITPASIQNLNYCLLMGGIPDETMSHIHKNLRLLCPCEEFTKLYQDFTTVPYNFMYVDCGKELFRKNFDLEYNPKKEGEATSSEEELSEHEEVSQD